MTDVQELNAREHEKKTWINQIPIIAITAISSLIIASAVGFGSRIVSSGDSTLVIGTKVDLVLKQNDDQNKLLQDMQVQQGKLYTREEARSDREAAERRFQSMEGRIGDLGRRLETVEANQRFMQQFVIDKVPPGRRTQ